MKKKLASSQGRLGRAWLGAAALLIGCTFSARIVEAGPPQYWVLRAPAQSQHHGHQRGYYPAQVQPMSRQVYAYGWFGVPARQHWVRHEGYRHHYVQWRKR